MTVEYRGNASHDHNRRRPGIECAPSMSAPRPRSRARILAAVAFAVVGVCALAGILAVWHGRGRLAPRPDPDEAGFDAPDAAARFYALKRAPAGGAADLRARYRLALDR